jgi:glycosyltransferase involved in cell wall biosynthesis
MSMHRIMFLYWGRRGLARFVLELSRAALRSSAVTPCISVSRQNEAFAAFARLGPSMLAVDTFRTSLGALAQAWRIPVLQRRLLKRLAEDRIQAVVDVMPHVWSPFIAAAIRRAGVCYVCVLHDHDPHPGDWAAPAMIMRHAAVSRADHVLTLSKFVADRLIEAGRMKPSKVSSLFFPDLSYGRSLQARKRPPGAPLRLLFFGRIMRYKGLDLFIEAIELLRMEGITVKVGVFGEGPVGANAERLSLIGAEVVNRWIAEAEIPPILERFDAVVASHIEASQSGVVGMALGAGLPVVATPVGGLVEQVVDGVTGIMAAAVNGRSLADAVKRLLDAEVYAAICENIVRTRDQRSMDRFVNECVGTVAGRLCRAPTAAVAAARP